MRRTAIGLSLIAMLAAGPTLALEVNTQHVAAADLIALCGMPEENPNYHPAVAFCYGYLDAALDYHAALTAGPRFDGLTCPPAATTREQIATVIVEWAGANPGNVVDGAPPVHMVMQAMTETWPCQKN